MMRWSLSVVCCAGLALAAPVLAQQLPLHVRAVNAAAASGGNGTSWATAFSSLRTALSAAAGSGGAITELWIAQGEYSVVESPGNCIPFVVSIVSLYGGFEGFETSRDQRPAGAVSILKADGTCDYFSFFQVLQVNTAAPVVIDSILITQANGGISVVGPATITNVDVRVHPRAALAKGGPAMLYVRHCRFDNRPSWSGPIHVNGPAFIEDSLVLSHSVVSGGVSFTGVTVRNCTVHGSGMGGGGVQITNSLLEDCLVTGGGDSTPVIASGATFRRCTLSPSGGTGGGVDGTNTHFENCSMQGGIYSLSGGSIRGSSIDISSPFFYFLQLTDGLVSNSVIRMTGRLYLAGTTTFVNTRFTGVGPIATGIQSTSAPHFINCLLQHSTALSGFGDSRIAVQPGWQFSNCILWGPAETEAEIFNVPTGLTGFINHSIVRGWTGQYGGAGNSGADPLLDAAGRPQPGSPAIDAGDNSAYPIHQFPYDFVGNCRIVAATSGAPRRIDIGPYEFPACPGNCDCSSTPPLLNILDLVCFLQRFAAADPWANCDQSTTPPVLNIADFSCFLQQFAQGCP